MFSLVNVRECLFRLDGSLDLPTWLGVSECVSVIWQKVYQFDRCHKKDAFFIRCVYCTYQSCTLRMLKRVRGWPNAVITARHGREGSSSEWLFDEQIECHASMSMRCVC